MQGEPRLMVGAHLDVSQRKGLERQLRASGGGPLLRGESHAEGSGQVPQSPAPMLRGSWRARRGESLLGAALCRLWWLHWASSGNGAQAVELGRVRG